MERCLIIAEAGSNFKISDSKEENFKQALKLINIAKEAGADAVKFQLFKAKSLYAREAGFANYLGKEKSIYEIIEDIELPEDWLKKLKDYCENQGLIFLCTPFDIDSFKKLEEIDTKMYKIASYSLTNLPLLKEIARTNKPIILSTGASYLEDIKKAIETIKSQGNNNITLLQCTAKYPCLFESVNLNSIVYLKKEFNLNVGLSDHSRDPIIAPLGARALGALVIEKHFTTDNNLSGPDHKFAILPHELKQLVSSIRNLEKCLGKETKTVLESEQELYDFCKNIIYAKKPIKKGEIFSKDNLIILRKGKYKPGLNASEYENLLGKTSKRHINELEPILKEDLIDFKKATEEDCLDLFNWRNDPDVRENSFNSEEISFETHKDWFLNSLNSDKRDIFILFEGNEKLGVIRFDVKDDFAEISITVKKEKRGQGYASAALKLLSDYYLNEKPINLIIAKVKSENIASLKSFQKAGYVLKNSSNPLELIYTKKSA